MRGLDSEHHSNIYRWLHGSDDDEEKSQVRRTPCVQAQLERVTSRRRHSDAERRDHLQERQTDFRRDCHGNAGAFQSRSDVHGASDAYRGHRRRCIEHHCSNLLCARPQERPSASIPERRDRQCCCQRSDAFLCQGIFRSRRGRVHTSWLKGIGARRRGNLLLGACCGGLPAQAALPSSSLLIR